MEYYKIFIIIFILKKYYKMCDAATNSRSCTVSPNAGQSFLIVIAKTPAKDRWLGNATKPRTPTLAPAHSGLLMAKDITAHVTDSMSTLWRTCPCNSLTTHSSAS